MPIAGRQPAGQFPNPLDRIEFGTVWRQEHEREHLAVRVQPGLEQTGMVVLGVVQNQQTRRLPRERCLGRRIKKRWKDSPLNIGSKAVTSLPVRMLAAPKHATDLRVGACKRMGALSSGGTHIRQRVPCCWKWHSSEPCLSGCHTQPKTMALFR